MAPTPNTMASSSVQPSDEIGVLASRTSIFTNVCAILLAAIPTLAGTKRGLVIPGLRISEFLVLVLLLMLVFRFHKKLWIGGRAFWPTMAYAAFMAIITAYHSFSRPDLGFSGFLDSGLGPSTFLAIYICSTASNELPDIRRQVCRYLFLAAAAMGLTGLLQTVKYGPALDLGVFLTGNQYIANPLEWKVPRSVGFFNSWHAFAGYTSLSLILIVSCGYTGVRIYKRKWILPLCGVLVSCGLVSSLTFGIIGMTAIILVVLSWKFHRMRYVMYAASVLIMLYIFTPLKDSTQRRVQLQEVAGSDNTFLPQTVSFRIEVWVRDFIPLISENPIFGYGPITELDRTFSYVESMYILVLLMGGLAGLVAFVVLVTSVLGSLLESLNKSVGNNSGLREYEALSRGALYFSAGLIPMMLIHPYLNDAGASQLIFVMVGLLTLRSSPGTNPALSKLSKMAKQ